MFFLRYSKNLRVFVPSFEIYKHLPKNRNKYFGCKIFQSAPPLGDYVAITSHFTPLTSHFSLLTSHFSLWIALPRTEQQNQNLVTATASPVNRNHR